MKIIVDNSIIQGIFVTVVGSTIFGLIMVVINYLLRMICPIRKKKVFSSYKYDKQKIEDGSNVLQMIEGQDEFLQGAIAHCIYRNISSHNIAVDRAYFVIDKISLRSYKRVDIICHYAEELIYLYVINNGNVSCYDLNIQFYAKDCTENDLKELLGKKYVGNYSIAELKKGEILKLGVWKPNKKCFLREYLKENWLIFCGNVHSEGEELVANRYLGTLLINNNKFDFTYCQGDTPDVESRAVYVDKLRKKPQKFELDLQYALAANSDKHIQVAIYPSETCYIKYHFEVYTDTVVEKCESDVGQAHINVPIYKTEGAFFHTLREWLMDNKIEHYYLNDDKLLQKKVLSYPLK